MVDYSSINFPIPKDWQAFERACHVLFTCVWGDQGTQLNGRSGQKQSGVDIFGRIDGGKGELVGVQCKKKNDGTLGGVTEEELRDEVKKAKKFRPALSKFIVVTTAPNDVAIQKIARQITERHKKQNLFSVEVWGWDDLQSRISQHPNAVRAFYPDGSIFTDEIKSDLREEFVRSRESDETSLQLLKNLTSIAEKIVADKLTTTAAIDNSSAAVEAAVDKVIHETVDEYRDLLRNGRARTAFELLTNLKAKIWETATERVRFRILTNLGACHLRLGEIPEAAKLFGDAFVYAPQDKIALSNRILSCLLVNDRSGARVAADDALKQLPHDPTVVSHAILAYDDRASLEIFISTLPEEVTNSYQVALAISEFYRKANDAVLARKWIETAYQNDGATHDEVANAYALILLAPMAERPGYAIGAPVSGSDNDDLRSAIAILKPIWDRIRASECARSQVGCAVNLANAYRLAGALGDAKKTIDEGFLAAPDDADLLHIEAYVHFYEGEYQRCLDNIKKLPWADDRALMSAAALSKLGKIEEALQATNELAARSTSERHQKGSRLMKIEILENTGNFDPAVSIAEELLSTHPYDPETSAVLAQLYARANKEELAEKTLKAAVAHLPADAEISERFQLALEFHRLGKDNECAALLTGNVDYTRDSDSLRLLLASLIDSDRRETAKTILDSISAEQSKEPFFRRARISYFLRTGSLEAALSEIDEAIKHDPANLGYQFNRVAALHRLGRRDAVLEILRTLSLPKDTGVNDAIRFASVLDDYGFGEKALAIAYEALRNNHDDAVAHAAFYQLVLNGRSTKTVIAEPTVIAVDVAFTVKTADNSNEYTYIIVDVSIPLSARGELRPDHPLAKRAIGKQVGDQIEVIVGRNPPDLRTISEVKHKYIHALHKGLDAYENTFPTDTAFERVRVHEGDGGLDGIIERVKRRGEWLSGLGQQYTLKRLPLGVIATLLKGTTIDAYMALAEMGTAIKVCDGTREERDIAVGDIRANKATGCIVDAFTLNVIRRLDIASAIETICGPIHITQSTLDAFQKLIDDAVAQIDSPMSLVYRDGQMFREERDALQTEKFVDLFKSDMEWIRNYCRTVPADGEISSVASIELSESLDHSSFDTLLAAKAHQLLLVSEDHAFRIIAQLLGGVRATWLQPILMIAHDQHKINRRLYSSTVGKLLAARHEFTSVASDDLFEIARANDWNEIGSFKAALASLGSAKADLNSSASVTARFLLALWKHRESLDNLSEAPFLSLEKASTITFSIFNSLANNHWDQMPSIIGGIWKHIRAQLKNPDDFNDVVLIWLRGHFFVPFAH